MLHKKMGSHNMIKFHQSKETLNKIREVISKKEKGAYFRFGDGDIRLANNITDLMQDPLPELAEEMREALAINHPNVLKTLPLYCKKYGGLEAGMFPGNHECPEDWCEDIIAKAKPFWGGEIEDTYSHVALSHLACIEPDFAISFLKDIAINKTYFIGNKDIPFPLLYKIFPKFSSIFWTPPRDSYVTAVEQYDSWIRDMKREEEYLLVVTCMGCSGRAIQKRLYKDLDNVFLFDFGSLMDALCGWNTRAWIELTKFDKEGFLKKL